MKTFAAGLLLHDKLSPFGKALTDYQCIRYALDRPSVTTAMLGMKTVEEVARAAAYAEASPEETDYTSLLRLSPKYSQVGACVYCNHCLPCPAGLNIAQIHKYVDLACVGDTVPPTIRAHYAALSVTASACIGCGSCEKACPFGVQVRERMQQAERTGEEQTAQLERLRSDLSLSRSHEKDLEKTLNNLLAYCFNLEYNVNALTVAMDTLRGTPDTIESGDWTDADYLADDGTVLPLHRKLYDYTATITPRCKSWVLNTEQFDRLHTLARRCQAEGVRLIVVLPPMADNVRTEVCDVFGITDVMQDTVLPQLTGWAAECGFTLLDYEWGGSAITDDDTQFFDGFHLDEKYGLPVWTQELFNDIAG